VAVETARFGVGQGVEAHTRLVADLAYLRVADRAARGKDRADARIDQHIRPVLEREEAVAVRNRSLRIVASVASALERELAATDTILLTHAVPDQHPVLHERDRVGVRRGADCPGQQAVLHVLIEDRCTRRHERVVRLHQEPATHVAKPITTIERERRERRIHDEPALVALALQHVDRTRGERRRDDAVEQTTRSFRHAMREQDIGELFVELERRQHESAENRTLVTVDHLAKIEGRTTRIPVLHRDRDLNPLLEASRDVCRSL